MMDILMARSSFYARADWTEETAAYVAANKIAMEAVNAYAGVLARMDCSFLGNGHFTFDGADVRPSVVIEVYAEDDETTIDLCAWPIDQPERFATLLGSDALGMARTVNPATWALGGVLKVYRTPLRWLQADCQGCVVLDHRYVPVWLGSVQGDILAEDITNARQLDAWLNPPRFDRRRILVPHSTERRAA